MASRSSVKRQQYIKYMKINGYIQCGICSLPIVNTDHVTVDHIIPKSKGGSNRVDNMQPAHRSCNEEKDDHRDFKKDLFDI